MDRPKRPINLNLITIRAHDNYTLKLEAYCDELEKQYERALSDVVKYTMALDKVSNELAYLQSKLYESVQSKIYEFEKVLYRLGYDNYAIPLDIKPKTADDVKEWALRGVSEGLKDD